MVRKRKLRASQVVLVVTNMPLQETQEIQVSPLGWGDPLEKEMATHSSNLAWKIPWSVHGVTKSQDTTEVT